MSISTNFLVSSSAGRMGRPRINAEDERITARFAEGTLARIKAALEDKESQAELIRVAVEKELERREKS